MTMIQPRLEVPSYFRALAMSVPLLIGCQLFFVGFAVFADGIAWDWHRAFGSGIGVVILAVLVVTCLQPALRSYRRAAALLLVLYCFQFIWLGLGQSLESGAIRALHAANAMLLTAVSVLIARRTVGQFSS
jgi:heme A synthase